jgi:hypothetical protein
VIAVGEVLFILALALVNLTVGISLAIVLARRLGAVTGSVGACRARVLWFVGIYFLECVAFAVGMATQVFTIALGLVWGLVFGFWLQGRRVSRRVTPTLALMGVYTSLPSVSFGLLLLGAKLKEGTDPLSTSTGVALGIPRFVPWPLNTVLGFCLALAFGTLIIKLSITAGVGSFVALRNSGGRGDRGGVASGHA